VRKECQLHSYDTTAGVALHKYLTKERNTHFKRRHDKITQNIYNEKAVSYNVTSEKWVYVADIWVNLKNEESKQMVDESNVIITSTLFR